MFGRWTGVVGVVVLGGALALSVVIGGRANRPKPGENTHAPVAGAGGGIRTRAQVEELIRRAGRTQPAWWDSVPLTYPETLDLKWPEKPEGVWDNTRNVNQYLWDVINPNPSRWREGAKFVHYLARRHRLSPAKHRRAADRLGCLYHDLLGDWARAAFWWRASDSDRLGLAHCYWKLGSKEMSAELLKGIGNDTTPYGGVIKLWADLGEVDKALALAEVKARTSPAVAYRAAGDVCRQTGRYRDAIGHYRRALATPGGNAGEKVIEANKRRAQASLEAVTACGALELRRIPDGTFRGASLAYAGQLQVAVTVRTHRLTSVEVTKHQEKQFYTALADTPKEIVRRQCVKGVDAVSGATMTSEAILNATAKALASAVE
jgi:uncharacterized protein with FMN-binding domain